jgi:hypothetical protein
MNIVVMRDSPLTYLPEMYGLHGSSVSYMTLQMIFGSIAMGLYMELSLKKVRLARIQQKVQDYYDKSRTFLTPKGKESF